MVKMAFSRVPLFHQRSCSALLSPPFAASSSMVHSLSPFRRFRVSSASVSASSPQASTVPSPDSETTKPKTRWQPMCLYFTQGKCQRMDDPAHLEIFNHNLFTELRANTDELQQLQVQPFDFFLVLDLEGKVEILEFPVLMIDAKTLEVVDFFHRFVRPSKMSEQRINEYILGKYKAGIGSVWHDTAIPFEEVIQEFEDWLTQHHLWDKDFQHESGFDVRCMLHRAAFVTCGNWDLKTKVREQFQLLGKFPPRYFWEWINLKDAYLNFYKRKATGMLAMMRGLQIPMVGTHHLGIDDTKNIAKVVQRMLADGAVLNITARRRADAAEQVNFLCKDRIV